ncbi:MAG: SPFH domain-containing protein [Nostocaceae cyanobacterium]|nr:SPFH domain-containing protein [Nostocaceae cyanobacterium]
MESIIAALAFVIIGYTLGSTKMINEGNEALVERLGKYHRKLTPGLNFIVPFVDQIVLEDTVRQRVLDIEPQLAITKDNVSLEADAVIFWKVLDLEKSFYGIDDIEGALKNIVLTTLRSTLAEMNLEETIASRTEINRRLLQQLDDITAGWGVKVLRVELQNIKPPESVLRSMEEQRAAEIEKRATVSKAQGEREAEILRAEGTKKSMQLIAEALGSQANTREILRYLVAQDFVEASQKLGESPNAKIVFVDPAQSANMLGELVAEETVGEGNFRQPSGGNGSPSP